MMLRLELAAQVRFVSTAYPKELSRYRQLDPSAEGVRTKGGEPGSPSLDDLRPV